MKLAFNFKPPFLRVTVMFLRQTNTADMPQNKSAKAGQEQTVAETTKVEIVLEEQAGSEQRLAIKYLTWTEGLGWCCQKTIRVDADQLDELHRAITVARHRVNRHRAASGLPVEPAQVIQLPTIS